jgi:hypothetical protein
MRWPVRLSAVDRGLDSEREVDFSDGEPPEPTRDDGDAGERLDRLREERPPHWD